jgi:ubiquinone/menaquinone biosynthesis C-methylase UbiE
MDEMGFRYVGGDISLAMIGEARKTAENRKHVLGFANADAAQLPFRDNSADCVMLWRLLHHIHDSELRCRMLREAARVTRNKVLVSFHHPISFTYARKFIQRTFFGQAYGPTITQWRLRREAESCGLKMLDTAGFRKYVSVNWFACLVKSR